MKNDPEIYKKAKGFDVHPENINKEGRPKKIYTVIFTIFVFGIMWLYKPQTAEARTVSRLHTFYVHHLITCKMENQKEVWKDVIGYEGLYQISNLGRIKSLKRTVKKSNGSTKFVREKIIKKKTNYGYENVALSKNGIVSTKKVHRIIAEVFIPNPENKKTINHKNGIRNDNRIENIEWSTYSENNFHAYRVLHKKPPHRGRDGYQSTRGIPVLQLTKNGEFVKEYGSANLASELLGLNHSNISSVCRGERKYCGGFIWKYRKNGKKTV